MPHDYFRQAVILKAVLKGLPKPQAASTAPDEEQAAAKAAAKKAKKQRQKAAKQPTQQSGSQSSESGQASPTSPQVLPVPAGQSSPQAPTTPAVTEAPSSSAAQPNTPVSFLVQSEAQPVEDHESAGHVAPAKHESAGHVTPAKHESAGHVAPAKHIVMDTASNSVTQAQQQATSGTGRAPKLPASDITYSPSTPSDFKTSNIASSPLGAANLASLPSGVALGGSEAEEGDYKAEEEVDWAIASGTAKGGRAGRKADACGFGGHTTGCNAVPTAVEESDASFLLQLISCPITKVSNPFTGCISCCNVQQDRLLIRPLCELDALLVPAKSCIAAKRKLSCNNSTWHT